MSDNTVLQAANNGDKIRTIDRGAAKTQVIQLDYGGETGPEALVTSTAGLPIVAQVGATWAVTQSGVWSVGRTWVLSSGTDSVTVAGSITASGTVTVSNLPPVPPVSGNGNLLTDIQLAGVDLGPQAMDSCLPVVLALDQDIPHRPTGAQPTVQSIAVSLATDHTALPIAFPTTVLAPNAAQEAGGNLAAIAGLANTLSQLVDIARLMLAEMRAQNLQLASITGLNIDPAIGDEQVTFN